ncbi:hypothetical protein [Sphingobacterium griseoflavum]|nr:hypothetical protein [Sphingobacterium griseoflavum]
MEYFDQQSAYEFKYIGERMLRCWHITGGSIDITVNILPDKSLHVQSANGPISKESNEKLFLAIERAYTYWGLL